MSLLEIRGVHPDRKVTTVVYYYAGPEKDLALLLRNTGRYRPVRLLVIFGVIGYVVSTGLVVNARLDGLMSPLNAASLFLLLSIVVALLLIYFNVARKQLHCDPEEGYNENQYKKVMDELSKDDRAVHIADTIFNKEVPCIKRKYSKEHWDFNFSSYLDSLSYSKTVPWKAIMRALEEEIESFKKLGYGIRLYPAFEAFASMLTDGKSHDEIKRIMDNLTLHLIDAKLFEAFVGMLTYGKSNDELKSIMDDLILHIIEADLTEEEIVVDAKVAMRKAMPLIYGQVERNRFEYRAVLNNREIDQYIANSDEEVRKASEATEKESLRKAYRMRNKWP